MDRILTRSPKNLRDARESLDLWKETYASIAARAFLAVVTYEQYLRDEIKSTTLATVMRELRDVLPDDGLSEAEEDTHSGRKTKNGGRAG